MAYNHNVKLKLDKILDSPNVAELLTETQLNQLGHTVSTELDKDIQARQVWEERMAPAMAAAMQIYERRTYPWEDSSNIKFPIIPIAAIQYHVRAYDALLSGNDLVHVRAIGTDPDGIREDTAQRIGDHMSYQLLEEQEEWESEMDRCLLVQSIMGCAFKKIYYCVESGRNKSLCVSPWDLVVPYYTTDIKAATRATHLMKMSRNELYEREASGRFLKLGDYQTYKPTTPVSRMDELRSKTFGAYSHDDDDAPYDIAEQHRWLDLDGDGYKEPYVVTFVRGTHKILRIVARFFHNDVMYQAKDPKKVAKINARCSFVKYPFIPAPDGCFYDMGFGSLLGGINSSIDSLINQLIDAGTMSNLGGGFISRGLVVRSGDYGFSPAEWKKVDATGAELKDGIYPLPVNPPSQVLFDLLGLLLQSAERLSGATETTLGDNPGQNTSNDTYREMVEQGSMIFSGVLKRTWRAFRAELRAQFELNMLFLNMNEFESKHGKFIPISIRDYIEHQGSVRPSADPEIGSQADRLNQAQAKYDLASQGTGYDMYEVSKDMLKALKVSDIDRILPPPQEQQGGMPPPEPDPRITVAEIQAQVDREKIQVNEKLDAAKIAVDVEKAKVREISAQARAAMQLAQAEAKSGKEMEGYLAEVKKLKAESEDIDDILDELEKEVANFGQSRTAPVDNAPGNAPAGQGNTGAGGGSSGPSVQ